MVYDIAVIGGGPAGYTAAGRGGEKGLKTILFEEKAIGGVCLNEGCIPTKTLLHSTKLLENIRNAQKYGIMTEGRSSVSLDKIVARKNKIVKKLTAGVRAKLSGNNVETVNGNAVIAGISNSEILIKSGENEYRAKKIILCMGSHSIIPPINGLEEPGFWTYKNILDCKELPKSVAVIGGGAIGIELASYLNDLGVKTTVVEMLPEILGTMDIILSSQLRNELEKKGITFYLNSKVTEIKNKKLIISTNGKTIELDTDKILVSSGRKANVKNTGIENINIHFSDKGIPVNQYMQTNHPDIYACGDVTGFSMFAHTAIREAEVAVNHITGIEDRMSYDAIPSVVYTNPEFAGVGKTEQQIKTENTDYKVFAIPMNYSGRFAVENEMGNGMCKILTDKSNQIIGCHILGNPASELIVIAGIAIEKKITIDEFKKIIFPHPTVGEIYHEIIYK